MGAEIVTAANPVRILPMRHVLGSLWKVVLSVILGEFFKCAYRIWDPIQDRTATLTLIACSLFLAKQVIDLSVYYKHPIEGTPNPYDPPIPGEHPWQTLLRCFLENAQELFVLFFTYGAIQELSSQEVVDLAIKEHHLARSIGSGLLLSIAIVEFSWLLWDLIYIAKRLDACRSVASALTRTIPEGTESVKEAYAIFRHGKAIDRQVLRWLYLNFGFMSFFLLVWFCYRYSFYPLRLDKTPPDVVSALMYLLLPVATYFCTYHVVLRDVYLDGAFLQEER